MVKRLLSILFIFQFILIFSSCDFENPLEGKNRKERYDLPGNTIPDSLIEEVRFVSEQNVLYGFWLSSNGERPGLSILFCGGNSDSMDEIWDKVMILHELGGNVFVFDYRGFGMSVGNRSLDGLKADGVSALNHLLSRDGVYPDSILFYSYSIGNIVTFNLAAEHYEPFTLIAESPLAREDSFVQSYHVDGNTCNWLRDTGLDNIEVVRNIDSPLLIFNGEADNQLRYDQNGRFLYWFAPDPKEMILIAEAEHHNIATVMTGKGYKNSIKKWLYYCSEF